MDSIKFKFRRRSFLPAIEAWLASTLGIRAFFAINCKGAAGLYTVSVSVRNTSNPSEPT